MTVVKHDLLFRIIYGLGTFCGVALHGLSCWPSACSGCPAPAIALTAVNLVSAVSAIALFFVMAPATAGWPCCSSSVG